jgi:hypothetical protein
MLHFLVSIGLISTAYAENIERLGSGTPGIDQMWAIIRSIFPYTDMGGRGLTFAALKITDFILKSIGALAVVMIMYAGLQMIAYGEEGMQEAKKIVLYAVLGLIAAMVSDAVIIYAQVLILAAAA